VPEGLDFASAAALSDARPHKGRRQEKHRQEISIHRVLICLRRLLLGDSEVALACPLA